MIPIGIGLVYGSYCGVLWGVFLITGKNVGIKQLFSATWPPVVPSATATGPASQPATAPTGAQGTGTYNAPTKTGTNSNLGTSLGIETG